MIDVKKLTPGDLHSWVIAYDGVGTGWAGPITGERYAYEGQSPPDGVTLSPGWPMPLGYQVQMAQTGQFAGAGRATVCVPDEFLSEAGVIDIRPTRLLRLSLLPRRDFEKMAARVIVAVQQAEELRAAAQAQEAGILRATPRMQLPPAPGQGRVGR